MVEFYKKYNKRLAVLCATVLFVVASGYTCFFSLSKSLTVEVNERLTSNDSTKINIITNANMNKTLREVLEANNYPTDDTYVYGVDLDTKVREVDVLTIDRKVKGTITVDNEEISFSSGAPTIGDLLAENEIKLSTIDIVSPSVDSVLTSDNSQITINRQSQKREDREEAIEYETITKSDPNLALGEIVIDIPGMEGKKSVTEDVKYKDGIAISRNLVTEETLLEPINQVVRVGTGTGSSGSNSTGPVIIGDSDVLAELGYNGTSLTQQDYNLVCAIVEHEAGSNDYESALAVMSCVMNRVASPNYPDDPVSVLTAPGQFASYLDGYYTQFLNNTSYEVNRAVRDALNGARNHNYLNFRSYQTSGSVKIGGNWFF